MSIEDPIVNEVRDAREKLAQECNFDFKRITEFFSSNNYSTRPLKKTETVKKKKLKNSK